MIESKVMVSTTGHDGPMGASGVKRLQRLGMLGASNFGMGALDMNVAEDAVVDRTREIVPGMVCVWGLGGGLGRFLNAHSPTDQLTNHQLTTRQPPPPVQVVAGMEIAEAEGLPRMG